MWLPQGDTPGKPDVKIGRENDTCKTSGVTAPRPCRRSLVFTVEKEETVAPNSQILDYVSGRVYCIVLGQFRSARNLAQI